MLNHGGRAITWRTSNKSTHKQFWYRARCPTTRPREVPRRAVRERNPILDDDQVDPAEYARLLDIYDNSFRNIAEGEVVKGTVLKVTDTEVVVDVGFKSEGIISIEEFLDETPADHRAARRHRRRAAREDRRPRRLRRPLARKSREDEDLGRGRERLHRQEGRHRPRHRADQGRPCRRHRRAGVPARQPDRRAPGAQPRRAARPGAAHARHQGQQEARQHRALAQGRCSRKRTPRRRSTRSRRSPRARCSAGVVKNITDYGAFIDLGGIDGLLHITDMSWGRVGHPSEVFKVNDEIDVDRPQVRPGDRARLARPQAARRRSRGAR